MKTVDDATNETHFYNIINNMLNHIDTLVSNETPEDCSKWAAKNLMSTKVIKKIIKGNPVGLNSLIDFMLEKMNIILSK